MATFKKGKIRITNILLVGFVLVFLMLILQTQSAKYSTLYYIPWLWFIILYLPPVFMLLRLKDQKTEINVGALTILSILFVLTTILAIIFQELAPSKRVLGEEYLSRISTLKTFLFFLIPLEGLLMYLIWKMGKVGILLPPDPKVFISYNHADRSTALKIKTAIEDASIPVIIDSENMKAGMDITQFIQESIKASTAILSIVSNKSLESAWVAKETLDTLLLENYMDNKKFIACYLDEDFFQNDYTLKTVVKIDDKLNEIQRLITEADEQGIDTRDLNHQKSRLMTLRNSLDGIIARLRDSLCIDIRGASFNAGMKKILEAIEAN